VDVMGTIIFAGVVLIAITNAARSGRRPSFP
jgi:hypothetical protein